MYKTIKSVVEPAWRIVNVVISVGNNAWILGTEYAVLKAVVTTEGLTRHSIVGVPAEWFNLLHHAVAALGLFTFFVHSQVTETSMKTVDCMAQLFCIIASMVLFEVTRRTDPGKIPKNSERPVEEHPGRFIHCDMCNIYQPYRSFHCRRCNQCIERYDHHCIWTNCCIGARNLRYLLWLLFASLLGLAFCDIKALTVIFYTDSTGLQLLMLALSALYTGLFYPVLGFFLTSMTGVSLNMSTAELKGKISGTNEYLNMNPYFNAWDFGSDYNFRACFNGYVDERPRWREPSHLTKILALIASNANSCAPSGQPHGHSHGKGGFGHGNSSASHAHPHPASARSQPAERTAAPSAARPSSPPPHAPGDHNV